MEKRELILQAAARAFGSKGFHDTKVEEIAAEAGVAKGTVYLYFKDKNTLLFEVLHYFRERYKNGLRTETEQYATAREKLLGYTRFHLAQFPNMVKFHKLNMEQVIKLHRDPASREKMKDEQEAMLEFLSGIIQQGIDEGDFRAIDARDAALLFTGGMHASVQWALINDQDVVDTTRAEGILDLIINGIGK